MNFVHLSCVCNSPISHWCISFSVSGVKIVFRVGLVLLKQMLGSVDKLRELQGMYETMDRLRNIPPESIKEEVIVQEVTTQHILAYVIVVR